MKLNLGGSFDANPIAEHTACNTGGRSDQGQTYAKSLGCPGQPVRPDERKGAKLYLDPSDLIGVLDGLGLGPSPFNGSGARIRIAVFQHEQGLTCPSCGSAEAVPAWPALGGR